LPDDAALDLAFIALNLAADRGVKSSQLSSSEATVVLALQPDVLLAFDVDVLLAFDDAALLPLDLTGAGMKSSSSYSSYAASARASAYVFGGITHPALD
jgi:hypothetical protein